VRTDATLHGGAVCPLSTPVTAYPGHPGHRQALLAPTDTRVLTPHQCACGNTAWALTRPYHTHQVIELPVIQTETRG
jgi:hypothetical protein